MFIRNLPFIQEVTASSSGGTIGGGVVGGTVGSVLFIGAGTLLAQDNANFFWDDTLNFLGIGNAAPGANIDITQAAGASGSPIAFRVTGGAHTTLANANLIDVNFNLTRTVQFTGAAGATTITRTAGVQILRPNYQTAGAGALVITDAATLYIDNAPGTVAGGGGTTLTSTWSLFVDAGDARFDGNVGIGTTTAPATQLEILTNPASTNTELEQLRLTRTTTGTAAAGIGSYILFRAENDGGTATNIASIRSQFSTVTAGSEVGRITFGVAVAGVDGSAAGQVILNGNAHFLVSTSGFVNTTKGGRTINLSSGHAAIQLTPQDERSGTLVLSTNAAAGGPDIWMEGGANAGDLAGSRLWRWTVSGIVTRALTLSNESEAAATNNITILTVTDFGNVTWAQRVNTSGSPAMATWTAGAHTTLDNANLVDINFNLTRTVQFTGAAGATSITRVAGLQILRPNYQTAGAGALTIDAAATLYIDNAPGTVAGGGGTTITAPYAIWVDAGNARFDGNGTYVFELPADATDPTAGGGAAAGRIPVLIGGATRYLAYY